MNDLPDGTYLVHQNDFGTSYLPLTPNTGYWVATHAVKNPEFLYSGDIVGKWRDPDTGVVYLDYSVWIEDYDKAIQLGKACKQLAIWDCARSESITIA